MLEFPSYSTPETDSLCKDIAKKSKGVCFLGFSGGKDSLCAWLQLRRYFDRIIPFHCATLPGMRFREKALREYEDAFGTHIVRMMDASLQSDLIQGIYQLREDGPFIASLGWHRYDKLEVLEFLRKTYNLPRAWCAFGIQASDSIDRRIYCAQYHGRNEGNRTFYPCWDWPHGEVLNTVRESGLPLSCEYKYSSRTIEGTPSATYTDILRRHFPEDYKVQMDFYPLSEAKGYRERMNEAILERHLGDLERKGAEGRAAAEASAADEGEKAHGGYGDESAEVDDGIYIADPDEVGDEGEDGE